MAISIDMMYDYVKSFETQNEVEASSDLTLYAYGVVDSGVFVKKGDKWERIISFCTKTPDN